MTYFILVRERRGARTEGAYEEFLWHHGMCGRRAAIPLIRRKELLVNGERPTLSHEPKEGDRIRLYEADYEVVSGGGEGRLVISARSEVPPSRPGRVRLQCGYHKCLTKFMRGVIDKTCASALSSPPFSAPTSFRHFFHRHDVFQRSHHQFSLASISGHVVDLSRYEDARVVRVIRDPRDLLVSGYFYHKRGAEPWSKLPNPTRADFEVVFGDVPSQLPPDTSLFDFIGQASLEEGLLAEIEFRRLHFRAMAEWPEDDKQIRTFRYEELLGNEARTWFAMASFWGLNLPTRFAAARFARKLSAKNQATQTKHIRDPNAGQWRKYFSPRVEAVFNEEFGSLLAQLGYR